MVVVTLVFIVVVVTNFGLVTSHLHFISLLKVFPLDGFGFGFGFFFLASLLIGVVASYYTLSFCWAQVTLTFRHACAIKHFVMFVLYFHFIVLVLNLHFVMLHVLTPHGFKVNALHVFLFLLFALGSCDFANPYKILHKATSINMTRFMTKWTWNNTKPKP